MELIINDSSLNQQYRNVHEFKQYLENIFIPLYTTVTQEKNVLFSKSDLYSSKITSQDTFLDFLTGKVGKGLTSKQKLLSLIYHSDYWDLDSKINNTVSYEWKENKSFDVKALYEASERDKLLISFYSDSFDVFKQLSMTVVKSHQEEIIVHNFIDLPSYEVFSKKESEKKITIDHTKQYHAVVYKNEQNHPPHFHILYQGEKRGAYQLPGLEERDISFPKKDKKKIDGWIKENFQQLIDCWNIVHPDRLINRIRINSEYSLVFSIQDDQNNIQIEYCGSSLGTYWFDTKELKDIDFPTSDIQMIKRFIEDKETELIDLWNKLHIKK